MLSNKVKGLMMTLERAQKNKWYRIQSISNDDPNTFSRFSRLGLYPGSKIMLKRKAPIFSDPLLVQVDESLIAMTKSEAKQVLLDTKLE